MQRLLTHEARVENASDLVLVKIQFSQPFYEFINQITCEHDVARSRLLPTTARHESSQSMTYFYCALIFEFVIDTNDGVRIYDKGLGQIANSRKLRTWRKYTGLDCVKNLVLQLRVNRNTERWIGLSK